MTKISAKALRAAKVGDTLTLVGRHPLIQERIVSYTCVVEKVTQHPEGALVVDMDLSFLGASMLKVSASLAGTSRARVKISSQRAEA